MNTLNISDIFNQFSFYQQHYVSIISNPDQYYTVVDDASLDVWPLQRQDLYLGDLLKLWMSKKWLVNQPCHLQHQNMIDDLFAPVFKRDDLYLYHLKGNAILGKAMAKVWSVSEQRSIDVFLESSLQYYCTYKGVA